MSDMMIHVEHVGLRSAHSDLREYETNCIIISYYGGISGGNIAMGTIDIQWIRGGYGNCLNRRGHRGTQKEEGPDGSPHVYMYTYTKSLLFLCASASSAPSVMLTTPRFRRNIRARKPRPYDAFCCSCNVCLNASKLSVV